MFARVAFLTSTITIWLTGPIVAAPMAVGLANKHPLSERQVGELLINELRCLACHQRKGEPRLLEPPAPDLSDVGSRVAPEYLRRFIAEPSSAHPGSTMPDLLAGENEERRNAIAEAISHYLISMAPRKFALDSKAGGDGSAGKTLFHSIGCIACHSPRDDQGKESLQDGVVVLAHVPAKYSRSSLASFLAQPTKARPAGRMPDMKLTPAEANSLASYLVGNAKVKEALEPRADLAARGKEFFQQYNCGACHKIGDVAAPPLARELNPANLERGCLAKAPGAAPRYNLSDDQIKAIRLALTSPPQPNTDKAQLAQTLTAFNCMACHVRDDFGGVNADRNLLFQSDAKNLGDDARIPPPLTLVGAKLQPVWMKKILFDGDSVRPYMQTRMPQFGEANLRHLPELFAKIDHLEPIRMTLPKGESGNKAERARAQELREAGRKLLGNTSLNCVACHAFNGKAAPNDGIELMTSFERLQPSWFAHFLRNPNSFRPRTVMPAAWPGGIAVDKSILNGDTDRQIEAIWYYLSLGTSAADPAGVQTPETKLAVTDVPRTYRGRSGVAGYRGIAVGFPQKISYAFNAETGTLSAMWRGDFIRVDRGGQGSGGFNPASRHVSFAQDISFAHLDDDKSPWPLRPVMTKEQRVNPNPLYPKNLGYQFKGYTLDDAAVPTFLYRIGEIETEDRSVPAETKGEGRTLSRRLRFDSPKAQTLWFRALTGKIDAESKTQFKTPELRLTIPASTTVLRPTAADANVVELLLRLEIPQGNSTLGLSYELLR